MLVCSSLYNELRAHESFRGKKKGGGGGGGGAGETKKEKKKIESGENVIVNDCF